METKKIYQKGWFIVLMLILFAPIGIVLMWQTNWNKIIKIALSIFFGLIFVAALAGTISGNDNEVSEQISSQEEQQVEQKGSTDDESENKGSKERGNESVDTEEDEPSSEEKKKAKQKEKAQSELEAASEMGQFWFQNADWDSVFKYKGTKVHYILDYSCAKSPDSLKKYGKYLATCSADLTNGFGASFDSRIYIFMNKNGIVKHVFYDEADGSSMEIPLDSIKMN